MDDKLNLQPSTTFDATSRPLQYFTEQLNNHSQSNISKPIVINRTPTMDSRHKIDTMSSLMSPPEATPYEQFSQCSTTPTMAAQSKPDFVVNPIRYLSPPISPETQSSRPEEAILAARDPILYPNDASTSPQPPLFAREEVLTQEVIDRHISDRARRKQLFRDASPPKREDYALALEFKSQVMKTFISDRRLWYNRERQFLRDMDTARRNAIAPLPPKKVKKLPPLAPSPAGVIKAKPAKPARVRLPPKPRVIRDSSTTPDIRPSRVHMVGSTREDKDFSSIKDYCPPIETLPSRPNSLKVEWKGAPLDLSNDPHRHLLHADEVSLASNLRLDCATYLTSKRRIFEARVNCVGVKEFRKTDSQQACKIDVNKASKLWTAFDKVGWFDEKYFRKFL
jgi:hypothetical protein